MQGWQSPSPEPESEAGSAGSPTPTKASAKMHHTFNEVKQELREIQASDEVVDVPAGQKVVSSKSSGESEGKSLSNGHGQGHVKRELSPTFKNPTPNDENPFLSNSTAVGASGDDVDGTPRAKKRVRMTSPKDVKPHIISSQPLLSTPPNLSASQLSIRSNPTNDSSSTVPSTLSSNAWTFHLPPPIRSHVANTMEELGVDSVIYTEPHYSNHADVPPRAKMFAGRMFTLRGKGVKELDEFESSFGPAARKGKGRAKKSLAGQYGWEYGPLPPNRKSVIAWCDKEDGIEAEAGELGNRWWWYACGLDSPS